MKKGVYVCILLIAVILAFVAGMVVGGHNQNKGSVVDEGNQDKSDVVGVYQTDNWNGEKGTLVLYADGTCQYPSGGNATWELDGDIVRITYGKEYSKQDGNITGMNVLIDSSLSDERISEILLIIEGLENIKGVYWSEETSYCQITLDVAESDSKTSNRLAQIDGVTILDLVKETKTSISEHEARIMENGLVLHEKFFEKVSD